MERLIESAFDIIDVQSDFLYSLITDTIAQISTVQGIDNLSFCSVYEGNTSSGEAGEVTEDGIIYLDSAKLRILDQEVALAIVAHEFAHFFLDHYWRTPSDPLEFENEADELAKIWGFDINKFRSVCGPPSIQ